MLSVHCDYFQAVGTVSDLSDLVFFLQVLCRGLNDNFFLLPRRSFWSGNSYSNSFKSHFGGLGGYSSTVSGLTFILCLPGKFLSQIHPDQTLDFFRRIRDNGADCEKFKVTRLDIALDDYSRRVSWDYLSDLVDRGDYVLVSSSKKIASKSDFFSGLEGSIYFGSPNSTKLLRFYDAEAVHGIPADRWEVQFRRQRAENAFDFCLQCDSVNQLGSLVTGAIDFIERSTNFPYPFWESIKSDLFSSPYPVPCGQPKPDLFRSLAWIDRQVGPTLAMLRDTAGENWPSLFDSYCQEWRTRYSPYHTNTIKKFQGVL